MTAQELLNALAAFIEVNTKDIILETRGRVTGDDEEREPDGKRTAFVYQMRLPDENAAIENIPYILLQFLTGDDTQESGNPPEADCKVRIVVVTYSTDYSKGAFDVLNIIEHLRICLLRNPLIEEMYKLKKPLSRAYYPDDTAPYFSGEMMTNWELPTIEREIDYEYH